MFLSPRISTVLFTSLLLAMALSSLSAQEPYRVTAIEVEGNRRVATSQIESVSGLQVGMLASATSIQEAIRRIHARGLFDDVAIDGELAGGGIKLRIIVSEYPVLTELAFEGNDEIEDKEISERLSIFVNQVISPSLIKKNAQLISDLYREEGYHQAQITSRVDTLTPGEIRLTYKIAEGEEIKIDDIIFSGNAVFDDGKLRGQMSAKPKGFLRSGDFKPDQFEEDKEKLIEFYNKNGFLDASIISDSIAIGPQGKRMTIFLEVYEGERYYFGDVTFSGNEHFSNEFLRDKLKFSSGDVYNSEKLGRSIEEIYAAYFEEGYIHARIFDQVQTVDSTLDINLEVSAGMPAKINMVHIVGNHKTKEKVIRRELYSQPGQIFRRSLLMRSLRNVMVLNFFANVEPDTRNLPNGDIDLIFKVEEKTTGTIQAGAGYSDYDKLVGTMSLGIPNFMGNGQNVSLDWTFGSRRNSIQVSFTEPWFLDTPTSVGIDLYNINRRHILFDGAFTENSRGFGLRLGRRLRWPDDYFKVFWRYRLEDDRLYEFDDEYRANHADDPNSLLRYENEFNRTSAMSVTLVRDSRNLAQFATAGSEISYTVEYCGGVLGGNWLYHKHIFEASRFTRLWWKVVLATKVRIGVIDSPDGESTIPYIERFAPGGTYGDGVIRGYDDRSVGPLSPSGGYLRGRSMLIYNAELQVPIVEQQIYGLLFADAGNAWLTGQAIKPFDLDRWDGLRKSYGAGFRIVVPGIGTLGFDFAYGLNNPEGAGWKPHFQIGTTF